MSKFDRFMKRNKIEKHNELYAATKSIVDENGIPVLWEFKHLTSKEVGNIRELCTKDVPVKGKPGVFIPKLNANEYAHKLIIASVVTPDLYDAGGAKSSSRVQGGASLIVASLFCIKMIGKGELLVKW